MRKLLAACLLAASSCVPAARTQPLATPSTLMAEGVNSARGPGQPPLEETYPDAAGMPRDVQAYIVRWNDCTHWAGEPTYDAARRRQIEQGVAQACTGVDDLGRRVRARHAGNAAVLARLADYAALEN